MSKLTNREIARIYSRAQNDVLNEITNDISLSNNPLSFNTIFDAIVTKTFNNQVSDEVANIISAAITLTTGQKPQRQNRPYVNQTIGDKKTEININFFPIYRYPRPYYWYPHSYAYGWNASHTHGHAHTQNKKTEEEQKQEALRALVYVFILAASYSCYLLITPLWHVISDNYERLIHNEGRTFAMSSYTLLAGCTVSGIILTNTLLINTLLTICVSAAFTNPLFWAALGATLTGFIITAGAFLLLNYGLKQAMNTYLAVDPLDLDDPFRFGLTKEEENQLKSNDFDIIRVKCAIIELSKSADPESLELIRKIRRGECTKVQIDKCNFELKVPETTAELIIDLDANDLIPDDNLEDTTLPSAPPYNQKN